MTPPSPKPAIADPTLTRPDWTVIARNAEASLRLDKNENSDPEFRQLLTSLFEGLPANSAMDYPEISPTYHRLAAHLAIDARCLLISAGSDGAIRAVFETFVSPGDTVVHTAPTFAMYPVYTKMFGAVGAPIEYRRDGDFPALSADELCAHIQLTQPRLVCLPNADSPTGTEFCLADIRQIISASARTGTIVLIDEAYHPFSRVTAIPLINEFDNLIVTRTFAKAWGLAGLRIGYLAAQPALAEMLHKVRPMYEVNGVALSMVNLLLSRTSDIDASVTRILDGKHQFSARMQYIGLTVYECAGNFIHVNFGKNRDAIHAALRGKVLYREGFSEPCLARYSRFTAAPPEMMNQLADLIEDGYKT